MRRLDRRRVITFIDASDTQNVCPVDARERLARFHAREDGKMLSGAAAFAAIWRQIPALRPIGLVARNRFVLGLFERAYRLFQRVRPALQLTAWRLEGLPS